MTIFNLRSVPRPLKALREGLLASKRKPQRKPSLAQRHASPGQAVRSTREDIWKTALSLKTRLSDAIVIQDFGAAARLRDGTCSGSILSTSLRLMRSPGASGSTHVLVADTVPILAFFRPVCVHQPPASNTGLPNLNSAFKCDPRSKRASMLPIVWHLTGKCPRPACSSPGIPEHP